VLDAIPICLRAASTTVSEVQRNLTESQKHDKSEKPAHRARGDEFAAFEFDFLIGRLGLSRRRRNARHPNGAARAAGPASFAR
jgi:hypothetical protein